MITCSVYAAADYLAKALLGILESAHLHAEVVLREAGLWGPSGWECHSRLWHEASHAWEPGCLLTSRWEPRHARGREAWHPLPKLLHAESSLRPWRLRPG